MYTLHRIMSCMKNSQLLTDGLLIKSENFSNELLISKPIMY